mmetsp:Transcript_115904/g.374492  ORF Transcript_115904/g.374492 Transcript_115904/m.374492 type:complete len:264 (+) Transcript_115904:990-1781(+)
MPSLYISVMTPLERSLFFISRRSTVPSPSSSSMEKSSVASSSSHFTLSFTIKFLNWLNVSRPSEVSPSSPASTMSSALPHSRSRVVHNARKVSLLSSFSTTALAGAGPPGAAAASCVRPAPMRRAAACTPLTPRTRERSAENMVKVPTVSMPTPKQAWRPLPSVWPQVPRATTSFGCATMATSDPQGSPELALRSGQPPSGRFRASLVTITGPARRATAKAAALQPKPRVTARAAIPASQMALPPVPCGHGRPWPRWRERGRG